MLRNRILAALVATAALTACGRQDSQRADSLQVVTSRQVALMSKLAAQKDSLTRVVLDADKFISHVDSQISTVKGLPKEKRKQAMESPIQEQLVRRQEMLRRVDALVARTKETAAQLAVARKMEAQLKEEIGQLRGENEALKTQLAEQQQKEQEAIAELNATIQRQTTTIAELQTRVDSLNGEMRSLAANHYRAYYVVGTEQDLLQKGIVVREGGANLLIAHPGRTLQPARALDPAVFTAIDGRDVREIQVPDTARRYQVISRQSLDDAEVRERDQATFKGNLHIANADKFWGPSKYLILLQR